MQRSAIHIFRALAAGLLMAANAFAQSIPAEEIRQAVRAYLQTQVHAQAADVEIEFRSTLTAVPVPGGPHRLVVGAGTLPRTRGMVSVPVDVVVADSMVRRQLVSVRVRTFGSVYVAAHQIGRKQMIGPEDVFAQRTETTSLPDDLITDSLEFAGKQTTRILNAGSVLRQSVLEPVPVVRQGERIRLSVRSGRVTIHSEVIAKEDGSVGKMIAVQMAGSSERIRARIVSPGTAEVVAN